MAERRTRAGWIVRHRGALGLVALAIIVGCAPARQPGSGPAWLLVHPPEVDDPSAPRGRRLLPAAPLVAWRRVTDFPTEAACDEARRVGAEMAIDRARAASGADARYDLDVRRAVHARCLPEGGLR